MTIRKPRRTAEQRKNDHPTVKRWRKLLKQTSVQYVMDEYNSFKEYKYPQQPMSGEPAVIRFGGGGVGYEHGLPKIAQEFLKTRDRNGRKKTNDTN